MKTIKIQLFEKVQHEVELKLPAFFKSSESVYRTDYFKIYESKSGKLLQNELNHFTLSNQSCYFPGKQFNNETCNETLITSQDYWNALAQHYDRVSDELNRIARLADVSIESEEDEPLDEAEIAFIHSCEAADVYNDEKKYKEFEAKNFSEVTKISNQG